MSILPTLLLEEQVRPEWVDYNGHMNDAAYAYVFTLAVDFLIEQLGLTPEFREQNQYSIYTLETHLCYLREAYEGDKLNITVQLLDYDAKRLHVIFVMESGSGERLATSEQMLMGMDMHRGRPAPFPQPVDSRVQEWARTEKEKPAPAEAGRRIGIRKN